MTSKQEHGVDMITQARLKELLKYDPLTGRLMWAVSRPGKHRGSDAGCIKRDEAGKKYRQTSVDSIRYLDHRLIWLYIHGELPAEEIDHIDGDGLNNKMENLRSVSHAVNQRNRRLCSNSRSGFNGVSWHSKHRNWQVNIWAKGKQMSLGRYQSLIDAVAARIRGNKKHGYHENHGQSRPL